MLEKLTPIFTSSSFRRPDRMSTADTFRWWWTW